MASIESSRSPGSTGSACQQACCRQAKNCGGCGLGHRHLQGDQGTVSRVPAAGGERVERVAIDREAAGGCQSVASIEIEGMQEGVGVIAEVKGVDGAEVVRAAAKSHAKEHASGEER